MSDMKREPSIITQLRKEGKLKEYSNLARAARRNKDSPAPYLLPDDHFRKRKRANITLSRQARAIAKKLGNGVLSRGVERALLHYHECPERKRK